MAELVITLSDGRIVRHRLLQKPMVIGRDAGCDLAIDEPSASRRHARFTPTSDGFIVEDLGSKNGTLVNDAPCKGAPLRDGDKVMIGGALAVFHAEALSSPSVVLSDDLSSSRATRYVPRDQALLLSQKRLQMIYDLTDRLTTLKSRDALLEDAMSICFEMLHFERGAIGIRRRGQRTVDWPVVRNLRGAEGELTISRSLLARALEHGERAIFTGDGTGEVDPTVSMVQHGIRSAMCVPLMDGETTIGVIYGDRTSTSASYAGEDIDFFAAIARQVSIGLINAQLLEDQKKMIALAHDLDLARTIQTGLFPHTLPNRPDLRIGALNDPGRRVSGDYYDVIERADGRVWCLVADVTGEGAPAAIQMANLQAVVRATIDECDDPGRLLTRWNEFICRNTHRSRIITCLLALVDVRSRTISLASAGHWPPLLISGSGEPTEVAVDAGFPLGVAEDTAFSTTTINLGAEPCMIFCFTDGVVEAWNANGEGFEMHRLRQSLAEQKEMNPQAAVKQVRKHVAAFAGAAEQSDDITMLAIRVGE